MKRTRLRSDREKLKEWKERSRRNNPLGRRTQLRRTNPERGRAPIKPVNPERRRKRRERDFGAKRDWIVMLPCLVCGRTPSDPHHEPPRSRGGTKEDLTPLCPDHHTLAPDSRHRLGSVERFREAHGIDLIAEARRLENAWRNQ